MSTNDRPVAIVAAEAEPKLPTSGYPARFLPRVSGRIKQRLGPLFGLANFGVNRTRLLPGAQSALRHSHTLQDEFVYILEGTAILRTNGGETVLSPGMCAGFAAGSGDAHHLVNRSDADVVYLEVGDRSPGDAVDYPDEDLRAQLTAEGFWRFLHKDGTPY